MSAWVDKAGLTNTNKRAHESVDYIPHNASSKRRDNAPSDVDLTTSKLNNLQVHLSTPNPTTPTPTHASSSSNNNNRNSNSNGKGLTTSSIPIPGMTRVIPALGGSSPTQTAAANAARRRAKSLQANNMPELHLSNALGTTAQVHHTGKSLQELTTSMPQTSFDTSNAIQSQISTNTTSTSGSASGSASTTTSSNSSMDDVERELLSGASFSVSIDTRETRVDAKSGNKHVTYQLTVVVTNNAQHQQYQQNHHNAPTNTWKVWHRYSEFVDFRSQLRRSNMQVTHLPPKTWQSNFVDTFLDSRQYALAKWVAQLPSIFLSGAPAEELIRIFLISSNMMGSPNNSGGDSGKCQHGRPGRSRCLFAVTVTSFSVFLMCIF